MSIEVARVDGAGRPLSALSPGPGGAPSGSSALTRIAARLVHGALAKLVPALVRRYMRPTGGGTGQYGFGGSARRGHSGRKRGGSPGSGAAALRGVAAGAAGAAELVAVTYFFKAGLLRCALRSLCPAGHPLARWR